MLSEAGGVRAADAPPPAEHRAGAAVAGAAAARLRRARLRRPRRLHRGHPSKLALARLLRKFFQNLRYGRERPKVARKLRSLAGGWAPLYGRAAAEEIFSEVI